jgi:hypothetical protein
MPDAGEIKAKVTIEYDGSGVEQAKKDLASLGDVGNSLAQSTGGANESLGALGEQLGANTVHVSELSSALGDLPKMLESGGAAASGLSETLAKSGSAIDSVGESVQKLQEPLGKTVSMLEEVAPPMTAIAEHAQSMEKQLSGAGESFAQIGESVAQSIPLLPQYAESMQGVMAAMQPTLRPYDVNEFMRRQAAFGLDMLGGPPAAENMKVFQAALSDPTPFDMIDAHLNATGQTYGDFASSIGKDNATILHEMNNTSEGTHQALGGLSSEVQAVGKDFNESANSAQVFADQYNGVASAATKAKSGISGVGGLGAIGAEEPLKAIGFGEAFSNATEGVMGFLNEAAMPIMAIQQIGMVVTGAAQGIYNMAAVAEGPGAHGVGTFTGTVDALGQSLAQTGQQFSEGFGKAVIPTLQQMNMEASQGSGSGGVGGFLGSLGSTIVNLGRIGTGMDVIGGVQGLMNQAADMAGMPLPFQGPAPVSAAQQYTTQQMGMIPQTVAMQAAQANVQASTLMADANNPSYLQAQDQLSASQKFAQHAQQSYDISHPISPADLQQQAQMLDLTQRTQQAMASQGTYLQNGDIGGAFSSLFGGGGGVLGGIGSFFGGLGQDFNNLFGAGGGVNPNVGCFPAGTQVLMADGSERAIETLQVGDQVLGHDGAFFVPTTVLARIVPPPKRVYTLTFDNGNILTLTDSHPIMTEQGWKSLHPRATKQENPDLTVSTLHIGDRVHTTGGMVKLVGIRPGEIVQIYNITVGEPHTFYASGILVHNKTMGTAGIGSQISDQIGNIQLPHIDLSGMASSLGGSFSGIQLPHLDLSGMATGITGNIAGIQLPHIDLSGIASGLGGAFSGIQLPHIDLSGIASGMAGSFSGIQLPHIDLSGITGSLGSMFSGISLPSIPDFGGQISGQLGSMFSGISLPSIPNIGSQISGELGSMFSGISLPSIPNIGEQISGELGSIFSGISIPSVPDIGGILNGAMGGIFSGISIPPIPNIGAMINSALSGIFSGISMPAVPFFAAGIENYTGIGIVGESGPELVSLNGGSVYPLTQSTGGGSSPLSLGGGSGGGSAPQSINLVVEIAGQSLIAAMGIPMAQNIRVGTGMRSF